MVDAKKVNAGRNAIRDFLNTDITNIAVGTGTTPPQETDTGLETEVIDKAATAEDGGDGVVEHVITLDTTEANGSSLTEVGTKNAGGLTDRITHAAIAKDNTFKLEYRVKQNLKNPA